MVSLFLNGEGYPAPDLCRLYIPHNKATWSYEFALNGSVVSIDAPVLYDIRNFYSPKLSIFSDMKCTNFEDYGDFRKNPPIPI